MIFFAKLLNFDQKINITAARNYFKLSDQQGNCVSDSCVFADSWRTTCPVRPYWKTYSIVGADERHVEFTNNYRDTIHLYWISVDGTWEKMAEIEQYDSATITETYSHVAWIATTADNRLMHLNGFCAFYPLEITGVQQVSITPDEQDEGTAVKISHPDFFFGTFPKLSTKNTN